MPADSHEPGWPATPGLGAATARLTRALDRHAEQAEQDRRDRLNMLTLSRIGRIAVRMVAQGAIVPPDTDDGRYLGELIGEIEPDV